MIRQSILLVGGRCCCSRSRGLRDEVVVDDLWDVEISIDLDYEAEGRGSRVAVTLALEDIHGRGSVRTTVSAVAVLCASAEV